MNHKDKEFVHAICQTIAGSNADTFQQKDTESWIAAAYQSGKMPELVRDVLLPNLLVIPGKKFGYVRYNFSSCFMDLMVEWGGYIKSKDLVSFQILAHLALYRIQGFFGGMYYTPAKGIPFPSLHYLNQYRSYFASVRPACVKEFLESSVELISYNEVLREHFAATLFAICESKDALLEEKRMAMHLLETAWLRQKAFTHLTKDNWQAYKPWLLSYGGRYGGMKALYKQIGCAGLFDWRKRKQVKKILYESLVQANRGLFDWRERMQVKKILLA